MATKTLTCLSCAQLNRVPEDKLAAGPKCGSCGAALMPTQPMDVDPAVLQKAAQNDDLPLIVDFWAPWCGPCKMMGPEYAKAARKLAGQARLVKLARATSVDRRALPDQGDTNPGGLCARQRAKAPVRCDARRSDHRLGKSAIAPQAVISGVISGCGLRLCRLCLLSLNSRAQQQGKDCQDRK